MRTLLYYVPGREASVYDEDIDALGLSHSIGGCTYASRRIHANGPDGGAGLVFAAAETTACFEGQRIGYWKESQTWRAVEGGLWVGWSNDSKPGPKDLERKDARDGHSVKLMDGASWVVPAIRLPIRGIVLPTVIAIGPDGELVQEDLPQYESLHRGAEQIWDHLTGKCDSLPYVDLIRTTALALSLNYRVGPAECSALRLFSTDNLRDAAQAVCDWPKIRALVEEVEADVKKNGHAPTLDGSPIGSGCMADALDTGQRGETSGSSHTLEGCSNG